MRLRLLALAAVALAAAAPASAGPPQPDSQAFLVLDGATGETLLHHGERRRVPIASITKLMTVLLALERARPDDVVTVAPQAAAVGESTIHLRSGERLTVRDLVSAALIQSANDAADALATYVGHGSTASFVALMNRRAARLGLDDTHFVRPDGLDAPGHVSSARDVTRLARVVMRRPLVRRLVRLRTATIAGGRRLHTWNDLLGSFPGLLGVKTGHTASAGWCQVAAAREGGVTVYAALLGSPSRERRNADLAALLRWGLSRYRKAALVQAGATYARAAIGYGRRPLRLVAARRVARTVRIDRPLVERVRAPLVLSLPVARGQRLGEVRVYAGRRLVARSPLVAAVAAERPNLSARVRWYAGRTVRHLTGWLP